MPTQTAANPVSPAHPRTVSEAVAFGKKQWSLAWRMFAKQWTQPQLMRLAEETLGDRCIHSSQIHGFATGSLRDPSPKLLRAIGELNEAIARSNGVTTSKDGPRCPGKLRDLWEGRRYLSDASGNPLGLAEVYLAVIGELDLGLNTEIFIPEEHAATCSKAVARHLRMELARQGMDWMEDLDPLPGVSQQVVDLLHGSTLTGTQLCDELPTIASLIKDSSPEQLWTEVVLPAMGDSVRESITSRTVSL